LIVNGALEGSLSPWVSSGTGWFYTNNGNYPHGGTGYMYFGVDNSVAGQIYQTVTIPSTAAGTLNFWFNCSSSESATTAYDYLYVEVRNTSGTLLSTVATYSNKNKTTAGSYSLKSFSLAAYKGQTIRLQFRTTTDSSVTTTFRIDDVSLK
jgi:thermitase